MTSVSAFPEGRPLPPPGADRRIGFQIVGDQWFGTLGMRVLEGRDFSQADTRQSSGVVIINQALADLEWPGSSAVGRRLKYAREDDAPWLTIVGVVSNASSGAGRAPRPEIYRTPNDASHDGRGGPCTGDPMVAPAIRAAAAKVDPANLRRQHDGGALQRAWRACFLAMMTLLFGVVTR
jgi:hypothetical protein